jgi:hypothetical protein
VRELKCHTFWQPWEIIENPSQELLDALLKEAGSEKRSCPDCAAPIGSKHIGGCDVARCLKCGGQRLSCDCEDDEGDGDIWDGYWPGTKECYNKKYVAREILRRPSAQQQGIPADGYYYTFDFNHLAIDRAIRSSQEGKAD